MNQEKEIKYYRFFKPKYFITLIILSLAFYIFNFLNTKKEPIIEVENKKANIKFGLNIDKYVVIDDTIKNGDVFGNIMNKHLPYSKVYKIAEKVKDTFDVSRIKVGKKYNILFSNDSLKIPQYFIYEFDKLNYVVVNFSNYDSINAYRGKKPFKIIKKVSSGVISKSLSQTMDENGLPWELINKLSDIYAWTIDFTRIQKGDMFKIIYNERYVEDSILVGIKNIEAAYFKHSGEDLFAFNFLVDSLSSSNEFYDQNGKSLQRAFLKSPLRFSNITSRYNLKRRIAYYGYRVVPHKGTDFAGPLGTPIMATADGRVIKSSFTRGNGYYVKIQHNNKYATQYLHMQKNGRVKEGQYVKQGDVIGKVGMTGNTSGPHVCYRFWKNGKQVDPFKQTLPAAKSLPTDIMTNFKKHILPLANSLNEIKF